MRHSRRSRSLLVALLGLVSVVPAACSPTYRADQASQAVQRICERDYHLHVSAKQSGHTLAVLLHHENIIQQAGEQIGLTPAANEVLANIMEAIHRVVLSSHDPAQFYLIVVTDPAVPGAYLTLVRYVEDLRRVHANSISPTEFFSRTILELKYDAGRPTLNLDQVAVKDIELGEFLSWQLAKRIQNRLIANLPAHGVLPSEIGPCLGEFENGELIFTLQLSPPDDDSAQTAGLAEYVFGEAATVIADVLAGYRFNAFEAVRLSLVPSGRNLFLPKSQLQLFR